MALTLITDHNESIYRILYEPPSSREQSPRYQSPMERQLKATRRIETHVTMGHAEVPQKLPSQYLEKGKGVMQPIKKSSHAHIRLGKMPSVPKRPDPSEKKPARVVPNFRVHNIKKIIRAKPDQPEPKCVDTRHGDVQGLKGSGLILQYCLRKMYGKMPKYLLRRNQCAQEAKEEFHRQAIYRRPLCQAVTQEERDQLLESLKKNWKDLQTAFIQLPVVIDTMPKKMKKSTMENNLVQLEKDIKLIEDHPYIYVYE